MMLIKINGDIRIIEVIKDIMGIRVIRE